jgi:phage I-like protein
VDGFTVVLDAPARPAKRIQIAQLGDFSDNRYGDFSITREDVESWKTNLSRLPGGRALIDLDHRADRSPRNTEAAGWITGIDWDGDTPVADVEWTPVGEKAISDRRYLFFSPTYGPLKTAQGETIDNVLQGGALTNKPFLSMPSLTLASEENLGDAVRQLEVENAERLLDALHLRLLDVSAAERKLAVKEGNALADGSYPIRNTGQLKAAAHLAATGHGDVQGARKLIKRRAKELGVPLKSLPGFDSDDDSKQHSRESDSRRVMDTEVLKALDLAEDTDVNGVVAKIQELQAAKAEPKSLEQAARDEGKVLLDANDYQSLKAGAEAGAQAAKELAAQKFERAFDDAVNNGRAIPAQKESLEHFYALDAESTLKMLGDGPQIVNTKPIGGPGHVPGEAPQGVDPESHTLHRRVLDYCKTHDLDPSRDYQKALDGMLGVGV